MNAFSVAVLVSAGELANCRFFFNDTATTEIYTLSLHDALPICSRSSITPSRHPRRQASRSGGPSRMSGRRSEEHTSELQSRPHLVCRLLLEKKKNGSDNKQRERKQYYESQL